MSSAQQLVGIVAAASEAIESWFAVGGDASEAIETAAGARRAVEEAVELGREAQRLAETVPAPVLQVVSDRLSRHWAAYERALAESPPPDQIQSIHFALLACMSKELDRLREHEPALPPGVMKRWWLEYAS